MFDDVAKNIPKRSLAILTLSLYVFGGGKKFNGSPLHQKMKKIFRESTTH